MTRVCDTVIRWSFYLLFFLVPLTLTPWNYELFEYNKMMTVYGLTVVIASAWLLKMANEHRVIIRRTPFDLPILAFVLSQLASTIFSIDPHVSWFGYYSRFNGGMWSVFSYVLLYHAFVSNFLPKSDNASISDMSKVKSQNSKVHFKNQNYPEEKVDNENYKYTKKMLRITVGTAVLVAAYGFLEHFGIDKHLWVQDVQSRVFSTLGQPNWLAAYLVAVIPLAQAYSISKILTAVQTGKFSIKSLLKVLSAPRVLGSLTLSAFLMLVLLYTRSRAGYLGLAAAEAVFAVLILLRYRRQLNTLISYGITLAAMGLVVFVNGTYIDQVDKYLTIRGLSQRISRPSQSAPIPAAAPAPSGTLLETGGTESSTIRKYVWQGAIDAWRDTPKNMAIGTGTETFAWTFFRYRPVEHNLVSEWDFLYNKAHNEYLNFLATTGAIGLGTYLVFLFSVIGWVTLRQSAVWRTKFKTDKDVGQEKYPMNNSLFVSALFAGWVSVLVTNFFGFSVVITQIFLFLYPALMCILSFDCLHPGTFVRKIPRSVNPLLISGSLLTASYLMIMLFLTWYADTLYASAYRLNRSGQYDQAQPILERAISLNRGEPIYHDELGNSLANITVAQAGANNFEEATRLAKASLAESDLALNISPENVNFWKTRTKIYYLFSTIDPKYNKSAIDALKIAEALSPRDPRIIYNLAILYAGENDIPKAIEYLHQAKNLKPNYRDAYNAIYLFYDQLKESEKAKAIVREYLTNVDPGDAEFKSRL